MICQFVCHTEMAEEIASGYTEIYTLKNYATNLNRELENICADTERIDNEEYRKVIQIIDVKQSIKSVASSGQAYVDSVDDMFYYYTNTNFSNIKESASNNDLIPPQNFVALMDNYLKQIGIKYESFCDDCKTAIDECNAAANRCCRLQAEARTRRRASRVIGGSVTAATIIGGTAISIAAGVFTFGIGTAIGLPLTAVVSTTAGVATHVIEQLHKQLHYVRLIGMCGKCPIATIQILSAFDYTAKTDGQTAKLLQYGNRLL